MVDVIIEIPANTRYKYEVDKNTGELVLDRPVDVAIPFNYGFVPNTLCGDGDPLDIFVISRDQIVPKSKCRVKVLGVYRCKDGISTSDPYGVSDDKLVGVLIGEEDLESEIQVARNLIEYYLKNYKKGFYIESYGDRMTADEVITDSHIRAKGWKKIGE